MKEPQESDLLTAFESRAITGEYKDYYKAKRQNFFATIQKFPKLWACSQLLDDLWLREFDDLKVLSDPNQMFPAVLMMNGHAKYRLAREVMFSACLGEAWDLLRGGIESVAQASKILREPTMLIVWLNKDGEKHEQEAFKDAFERNKKENLFPAQHGLDRLHHYWSQYSEWGSHTTVRSVAQRFKSHETATHVEWRLNYTGAEESRLALVLLDFLTCAFLMENSLYSGFRDRLQFDTALNDMRNEFQRRWQGERDALFNQYKIPIPAIRP